MPDGLMPSTAVSSNHEGVIGPAPTSTDPADGHGSDLLVTTSLDLTDCDRLSVGFDYDGSSDVSSMNSTSTSIASCRSAVVNADTSTPPPAPAITVGHGAMISTDEGGGSATSLSSVGRDQQHTSYTVGSTASMQPPSPMTREQLQKRIDSLQQENRVLKCEVEMYKVKVKSLQEENKAIRRASVDMQLKAEQEEEYISNTLLKKICTLKKEKESLAINYEQEEECLTNDLSRKLNQLRQEKFKLEHTLEREQECLVNKLMRRIQKLETETARKQESLDKLRREKIELENTLEQEQEALVNRLWKKMEKLEAEKRSLQVRLDQPISEPPSPCAPPDGVQAVQSQAQQAATTHGSVTHQETHSLPTDRATRIAHNILNLRGELERLRGKLRADQAEHQETMALLANEVVNTREKTAELRQSLRREVERRHVMLARHLSESSLDMEEETSMAGGHAGPSSVVADPVAGPNLTATIGQRGRQRMRTPSGAIRQAGSYYDGCSTGDMSSGPASVASVDIRSDDEDSRMSQS